MDEVKITARFGNRTLGHSARGVFTILSYVSPALFCRGRIFLKKSKENEQKTRNSGHMIIPKGFRLFHRLQSLEIHFENSMLKLSVFQGRID